MNSQQRAAMTMALEALEALKKAINDEDGWVLNAEKTIKNLEDLIADEWYENLLWGEALAQPQDNLNCKSVQARLATSWGYVKAQPQDHSEQHLNMVQGEWVDLTDDEVDNISGYMCAVPEEDDWVDFAQQVITVFKMKNTPPVVPQVVTEGNASEVRSTDTGEPVAWFRYENGMRIYYETECFADLIPLYTTPPSVEAAMFTQRELDLSILVAVEATKEKAAKVCDEIERKKWETLTKGGTLDGIAPKDCAAAIRSMK